MARYSFPIMELDDHITVAELAEKLALSPFQVKQMLANRAFPNAFRLTDSAKSPWRIPMKDVTDWMAKRKAAAMRDMNQQHIANAQASQILRKLRSRTHQEPKL